MICPLKAVIQSCMVCIFASPLPRVQSVTCWLAISKTYAINHLDPNGYVLLSVSCGLSRVPTHSWGVRSDDDNASSVQFRTPDCQGFAI